MQVQVQVQAIHSQCKCKFLIHNQCQSAIFVVESVTKVRLQ